MEMDTANNIQHYQQYILALLEENKEFYERYAGQLQRDDFTMPEAELLFMAIKDIRENGGDDFGPVTKDMRILAVRRILEDPQHAGYFSDKVTMPSIGQMYRAYTSLTGKLDPVYVAKGLADYVKRVRHMNIELLGNSIDVSTRTRMMQEVEDLVLGPAEAPDYGDIDLLNPEESEEDYTMRVPTNLTKINRCFKGIGLGVGEFAMLTAPTGIGKTTAMINFGTGAVAAGFQSLFITFELANRDIRQRFTSISAEIPAGLWGFHPSNWRPEYRHRLEAYQNHKQQIDRCGTPMFSSLCLEANTVSPQELREHIIEWQNHVSKHYGNEAQPISVYVDGFDFLEPNKGTDQASISSNDLRLNTISYQMLKMFKATGVAGWVSVQSNRDGEKTSRLRRDSVSGSYKLSSPVDLNIGLTAPNDEEMGDEIGMGDVDTPEDPYKPTTRLVNMNTIKARWSTPIGFELEQSESLRMWNSPRERQAVQNSLKRGDLSMLLPGV
jgi:hypothetical protein